MTPHNFITKWRNVELKERSASQAHFLDLCRLLGIDDPVTADPKGDWFTFEKGATKTGGGEGWADVWRRSCFAWEYKGKRKDLKAAFAQLQQYAVALENPPLLIVSDMDRIQLHTNWTNTVQQVHEIALDELADAGKRDLLRAAFLDPERLRPSLTRQGLTEKAAGRFAVLAMNLRRRGHDAHQVAHFVNRLIFCLFAEDVNLLPNRMFQRMIEQAKRQPDMFQTHAATLFRAMQSGGMVGFEQVEWFNGGLFDHADAPPLEAEDVDELLAAARLDWSEIDPSIMGTLFERGLDPDKRSQLGAHYTDRDKIMQIVEPVIIRPLSDEWQARRAGIQDALDKAAQARSPASRTRAHKEAEAIKEAFLQRLAGFRVLDPACGSGNFLYLALLSLKDLEHRVNLDAEAMGLPRGFPRIGPESVLGIELNPYAAELARVSVWIGEIQWMRRNGFDAARNPILRPLATIENRDAVLGPDGGRAEWPKADVVVGNPPFITSREMNSELGKEYTAKIRKVYELHVTGSSDYVAFWFSQALVHSTSNGSKVGLVATDSLPRGDSRFVLDRVIAEVTIFYAVRSMPWYDRAAPSVRKTSKAAQVRVCIICFGPSDAKPVLDGETVGRIESDLSVGSDEGFSRRKLSRLEANLESANQGIIPRANVNEKERIALGLPKASFLIDSELASDFCLCPINPNGKKNSKVIRPFLVGEDILAGRGHRYLIDFTGLPESEATLFEKPFEFLSVVKAHRAAMKQPEALAAWWLPWNNRTSLRGKIDEARYIGTPRNSKQRVFVWIPRGFVPDCEIVAITRDDDTSFGILSSKFHELWTLSTCSFYGVGNTPRYSHKATFETFPFPDGLTPDIPAAAYASDPRAQAIAAAAARLNELRENWLNPPDLVRRIPEVVTGYPDRILPVDDKAERELKKRTLTNLYNARPAWLDNAHKTLDEAVAEAYGWGGDWRAGKLTDDEILARLFVLNQTRAARPQSAT